MTESDWNVLQSFLLEPDVLDQGQLGQVIKNRLMDVLCAYNPPPAGLGDVLAKMYHDRKQGEVSRLIRDLNHKQSSGYQLVKEFFKNN